ncbi:DUF418 domain-containing protein [Tabrizicola sp.]|uniref:DUF418 domain-containing protein n=1 Tax=Tabrizicola sp. TaxID=2005166 RepID=UPI00261C6F8B|nr:DUF418 domain-containing protein [Tabrizicola sp.]MDM7931534.1 DUF418 domain-containing protein [Tabrizicola sp.]
MTGPPRALMPDYLRLIALFGIVVVNVQFIAFSSFTGFSKPAGDSTLDSVALWLVNGLASLKTYGLFSFMFGVGLGLMMRSAVRQGLSFGRLYRNRMIGLLILGLAHGCLLFPGDILTTYAVTGSIFYLFRNLPVTRLARVGAGLLLLQAIIAPMLILSLPETPADIVALERLILTEGSFLDVVLLRSASYAFTVPFFLLIQGTAALGWFCLGLAAVKSGMIDNAAHPCWRLARNLCLVPGVALGLTGAAIWQWGPHLPGVVLTIVAAPIATLGYLGLISAIVRPPGPAMARVLAAGGSSLSVYLGQSILLTTLFSGYGFGLWDEVSRVTAIIIAVAVTTALILALSIWRTRLALGPFEWVLRKITSARHHI